MYPCGFVSTEYGGFGLTTPGYVSIRNSVKMILPNLCCEEHKNYYGVFHPTKSNLNAWNSQLQQKKTLSYFKSYLREPQKIRLIEDFH